LYFPQVVFRTQTLWRVILECLLVLFYIHTLFVGSLVDSLVKPLYNQHMDTKNTTRKKRIDRNHIIYELVVNGKNYIGVTAKTESTVNKSVLSRAAKHFYRAKTETKNWLLCAELRTLADKSEIEVYVHEVIRGKGAAHKREVELRRMIKPILNTDVRGD
jgi:hypothetical protein